MTESTHPHPHPRQRRRREGHRQRAAAPAVPELRRSRGATGLLRRMLAGRRDCDRRAQATGGALEDGLSIYTWGEYDAPDVLEGFTAELGPKVTLDSFTLERGADLQARRRQGHERLRHRRADRHVHPADDRERPAQKLNLDLIPNLEHVDAAFLGRAWDPRTSTRSARRGARRASSTTRPSSPAS